MKKLKTQKTLLAIVDAYSKGASYNQAAKLAGVSSRTLWGWIAASRGGSDPDLMLEMYGETVTFERALVMGRRAIALEARSKFEAMVYRETRPVVQTFQGRVCWTEDPRTVGWTEDEREAFGFSRDGLLRNEKGETIPLTIETYVPVAATIKFLSSHFSEYEDKSNVTSTVTNRPTTGATSPPPRIGPPAVPPKPSMPLPLPELVVLPEPEPDLADILGDEPDVRKSEPEVVTEDVVNTVSIDPAVVEPGPRIVTPPADYAPTPTTRPISDKLAGLLRR